jgi:haloalkane dehalogenase
MTDAVRAPDERFEGLPDFPFESHYREIDGLRLCHLDEGEGRPVVFFHGEPTWSFLWRKVIPPVRDAGYRCIAPDYAGFGRSDKPTDVGWYTYDRHSDLMASLLEDLDLRDATVVVHDWGGPIGLRLAAEHQDRISRMVVMETGLFTGEQPMSDAWWTFHDFVERTEDFPISLLVRNAVARGMDDAVVAAYDAPFPTKESKAGARAFPLILPTSPEMPGGAEGKRAQETLQRDRRPMLVLWADSDPVLPFKVGEAFADLMGVDPPIKIENASHFLQEDAGDEIGRRIADWLGA